MNVENIIRALPTIATDSHHTNMYRDNGCCPLPFEQADTSMTPATSRLNNVRAHLNVRERAPMILVGEAAGWRGARQTGIAFTAPYNISRVGTRESSATTVQSALADLGIRDEILLWNACILHPHKAGQPASNLAPSEAALAASADVLQAVIDDRFVIAVGIHAARAVRAAGIMVDRPDQLTLNSRATHVRHPSYGGAKEFKRGLVFAVAARFRS